MGILPLICFNHHAGGSQDGSGAALCNAGESSCPSIIGMHDVRDSITLVSLLPVMAHTNCQSELPAFDSCLQFQRPTLRVSHLLRTQLRHVFSISSQRIMAPDHWSYAFFPASSPVPCNNFGPATAFGLSHSPLLSSRYRWYLRRRS